MTEFRGDAFFGIWAFVATVSVVVGTYKWGQEKAKREEEERQAEEAEQRSQEMLRLQRESRDMLEKIETRRIGDYFVADPPIAERNG